MLHFKMKSGNKGNVSNMNLDEYTPNYTWNLPEPIVKKPVELPKANWESPLKYVGWQWSELKPPNNPN